MGDRRLSNGVSCAAWLIIRDAANPVCAHVCVCICVEAPYELMNSYMHRPTHKQMQPHTLTLILSEEEEADETC